MRFLSVFVLSLFSIAAAAQDGPAKLLVLRVASNRLSPQDLTELTGQVTAKLSKYPNYQLLPVPSEDPMDMLVDAGCVELDSGCLATIGKQRGADRVLYTEVTEKAGRYQILLRFVDVKTKETQSPEGEAETQQKAGQAMAGAIEKVLGPEPVKEPALSRVEISSEPLGAEVYLDGEFVGLTPVSLKLKAGSYGVKLVKVGYQGMAFPLVVEEGKPVSRSVALEVVTVPVAPPVAPPRETESVSTPFYKTWWFWTAIGATVVGVSTAAYVLSRPGASKTLGSSVFTADPSKAPLDILLQQ